MSTIPTTGVPHRVFSELEWNDLYVVLAICRAGSLAGAARTLGHNHSTVFRKLNAIEQKTGVRFFERLPGGYAMTDAGRAALQHGERVEAEMQSLSREVLGLDLRLSGLVRVTGPEGLITEVTPALFARFVERHPEVRIESNGLAAALDLGRREADIAIRATGRPPESSHGRRVCDFHFALYASPSFLEDNADVPLAERRWCLLTGIETWLVPHVWKKAAHADERIALSGANVFAIRNAAALGVGMTALPVYLGDPDPRLVRVGDPIEPLKLQLWLLTHEELRHTARVKALMAFLYDGLKARRALFEGSADAKGA